MAIKVAIGGPPHSGKTVLMGLIRSLLPRDMFMVIEAAPDGEGITGWSAEADADLVKAVRRKGEFLPQFVSWVVESVRNSTMPVTLVDLGGMLLDEAGNFSPTGVKMTAENERILGKCDYLIVIANPNYAEVVPNWTGEADRLGVKTLAVLESVLTGTDEIWSEDFPLRARITRLERENPPTGSLAARAVATRILELAGNGSRQLDGSEEADVNFPSLAEELGLPLKGDGPDRDWLPGELLQVLSVVSAKVADQSEVNLWGNTPTGLPWFALACGLQVKVAFYDPKVPGYVELPPLVPQAEGSHLLDWRVEERDTHSFVEFVIPGQIFDVSNLSMAFPPTVNSDKGVILSGKGPRWLTGVFARAYAQADTLWVAVFSPQESSRSVNGKKWSELYPGCGPAVVVHSHDESHPVGMVVPFQL